MGMSETPAVQPTLLPLEQARREFEHDYLVRVLRMTQGNVTHAARLAGRNRTEFYRLLERHSLTPGMFKPAPRSTDPFTLRSAP
jgi:two-component system response regulator GlrR